MHANIPGRTTFHLLGPYDKRRRTSRCLFCARQHLKCSGDRECLNCVRRKVSCRYPASNHPTTDLSKKQVTLVLEPQGHSPQCCTPTTLLDRDSMVMKSFIVEFLFMNRLSSNREDAEYVQSHINDSDALHYAAFALGHVCRTRARKSDTISSKAVAFEAYEEACRRLSAQLNSANGQDWVLLMETTILLGFFELVVSRVGKGWRGHFHGGTRALFKRFTTEACLTGDGKRIFSKFLLIEVTSSMIFASRSFLAEQPWSDLSSLIQWDDPTEALHAEILTLALACSNICLPAVAMAFSMCRGQLKCNAVPLRPMAQQANSLQAKLEDWSRNMSAEIEMPPSLRVIEAWSMYHTVTLYLHNAFDVEPIWVDLKIETPRLSAAEVRNHTTKLLLIIDKALSTTKICPLFFLLPLYVAASCTRIEQERDTIISSLTRIGQIYEIANTCAKQISNFWMFEALFDCEQCPMPILKHHQRLFLGHLREEC